MVERKSQRNCNNFIPLEDGLSYGIKGNGMFPDCKSCVYFQSRNCGRDAGNDLGGARHPFY